ncbi:FAD binding domain-containing protein [Tropicimonas isoalkanivorans]|uniref:FAD binding domain-containing protein n=1 Tax=Tropicimonas isoalkanivorans TaxID=441112 RepID=A0A1I1HGL1_9RHOB|nr:FAD binding domain-containing protein [Tropicimonas isoalkanivorans]
MRKTTFHYGSSAYPLEIGPSFGVDFLIAPRRTLLDAHLVDAARVAGAEVRHRTALRELLRDPQTGRVTGAVLSGPNGQTYNVSCGIVIGADGRRSSVARMAGAGTREQTVHRSGCIYAYVTGLPEDGYHWYYGPGTTAGAIPTNQAAHCVFASVRGDEFVHLRRGHDREGLLTTLAGRANAAFGQSLADVTQMEPPVIFGGANGHIRESFGLGWALVGDAAYFKDPNTAHGITDALRDAEILANAVIAGTDAALAGYQARRDALSRGLFRITDRIASFDWTLRELQELHRDLNETMKCEQTWMAEAFAPPASAA